MPVTVDVERGELAVRITGWDVLWALSRGLRVPLSQVRDATVVPRAEARRRRGLRMMGSEVPGLLKAGRYAGRGWSEFWVTRRAQRVLVVTCAPGARYDRILLEVPEPDAAAERVRAAVRP